MNLQIILFFLKLLGGYKKIRLTKKKKKTAEALRLEQVSLIPSAIID